VECDVGGPGREGAWGKVVRRGYRTCELGGCCGSWWRGLEGMSGGRDGCVCVCVCVCVFLFFLCVIAAAVCLALPVYM